MTTVWVLANRSEFYDAEDRIAAETILIGIFASRGNAIKHLREEIIARRGMIIIDKDPEYDNEVFVVMPGEEELIQNYYVTPVPVW